MSNSKKIIISVHVLQAEKKTIKTNKMSIVYFLFAHNTEQSRNIHTCNNNSVNFTLSQVN